MNSYIPSETIREVARLLSELLPKVGGSELLDLFACNTEFRGKTFSRFEEYDKWVEWNLQITEISKTKSFRAH